MKPWIRRTLLGILFLALLAITAVVSAYLGRNFTGSGPVPTRSAFAGRLPGTEDGAFRRFQFFYVTNRKADADAFEGQGNKLGTELTSGTFDVRISPYMPIEPRIWFDTNSMAFVDRTTMTQDAMLAKLRESVQASPYKSVLVVVWGFRDWFRSAALKSAYTAYVLDINTPVLLFDWPGNQGEGISGYRAAQQAASQSAPDLGKALSLVAQKTGAENIWLISSSLGCQTVCEAFAWLDTQPDDTTKLDHVVLSAPDVAADAFNDKFAALVQARSRHLTAYVASNDRALLMSHFLNGERRLGRKAEVSTLPEERTNDYELEEGAELLDLKARGANNIEVVDATPINRTRNLHHFFTDSPEFFDDLYRHLLQPDNQLSRRLHRVRTRQGTNYWILWSK